MKDYLKDTLKQYFARKQAKNAPRDSKGRFCKTEKVVINSYECPNCHTQMEHIHREVIHV